MKQVIELLGKTVKFVHTENGHFFEEQGKVTEVLLSLSGENRIAFDEQDLYLLSDLVRTRDRLKGYLNEETEIW